MNSRAKVFQFAVDKLWGSLKRRHPTGGRYGPLPYDRKAFADWLLAQSINQEGQTWRCADSGFLLSPLTRKPLAQVMSLDHRLPLARGGTSAFSNLAIVSQACNLQKGAMTEKAYRETLWFLDGLPLEDRQDVLKRLQGYRGPNRRKS